MPCGSSGNGEHVCRFRSLVAIACRLSPIVHAADEAIFLVRSLSFVKRGSMGADVTRDMWSNASMRRAAEMCDVGVLTCSVVVNLRQQYGAITLRIALELLQPLADRTVRVVLMHLDCVRCACQLLLHLGLCLLDSLCWALVGCVSHWCGEKALHSSSTVASSSTAANISEEEGLARCPLPHNIRDVAVYFGGGRIAHRPSSSQCRHVPWKKRDRPSTSQCRCVLRREGDRLPTSH